MAVVDELAIVHVLLAAAALISCLSVQNKRTIRGMPRPVWVIVIVLVPLAGGIGWFVAGRPHRISRPRRTRWRDLLGLPEPPPPPAPEDDPEFLRSLDDPTTGQAQEPPHQPPDQPRDDTDRRENGQHRPGPGQDG